MPETILLARDARGRMTITLNRPDRGNAFDQTMLDELGAALADAAPDPDVRVLLIEAAGRHFCTGADLRSRGSGEAKGLTLNEVLARLDGLPKPVIGVVAGACLGGGLALAACCDVLVGTEAAFFSVPELRVGVAPSKELAGLLMRAMGQRAFRR
jgi:methylglutaconyl-CoA hydratase